MLVFLLTFGLFIYTAGPCVFVGDSGEFATQMAVLGISHPPGYPFQALLGKAWLMLIPFGNIGFRANILSGLFGALSCLALFALARRFGFNRWVSFLTALLLAFSQTFWKQAVVSEVYTMAAFFVLVALLLMFRWLENQKKNLFLLSLWIGIGAVAHYLVPLLLIPSVIFILWKSRAGRRRIHLIKCVFFFLLGTTFLLAMPVRSSARPLLDFGETRKISNFIQHLKRTQYSSFEFGRKVTLKTKMLFAGHFFKETKNQFTPILAIFIPIGLWIFSRRYPSEAALTASVFLMNSLAIILILKFGFTPQSQSVVEVYYLPAFAMCALWIGMLASRWRAGVAVLAALLLMPIFKNFGEASARNVFLAHDYAVNILRALPRGAHFFSSGDNQMFLLAYLQWVEKRRGDVTLSTDTGFVFPNIFGDDFQKLTRPEKEKRRREVFETYLSGERPLAFSLGSKFSQTGASKSSPFGMIYRVRKGSEISAAAGGEFLRFREISDERSDEYLLKDIRAQIEFFMGERYFAEGDTQKSLLSFQNAANVGGDVEWVGNNIGVLLSQRGFENEAISLYEMAIQKNPYDSSALVNLGLALWRKNKSGGALEAFTKATEADPSDGSLFNIRGSLLFEEKRWGEAEENFRRAVALNPNLAEAYNNLGVLLEKRGADSQAEQVYLKAVEIKPDYAEAYFNLSVIFWKRADWKKAVRALEACLRINPNHPNASKYLPLARERAK